MTVLLETVEILRGAAELAKFAGDTSKLARSSRDIREIQDLVVMLRSIYFSPRGVLSLLKIISDGGYPTEEQIELILTEFNDAEPFVMRARMRLEPDFDRRAGGLTLKAERVLREISYGKGGVRSRVQRLLNRSLTFGEEVSVEDANKLINEISNLNFAIEEAEEALVAALS